MKRAIFFSLIFVLFFVCSVLTHLPVAFVIQHVSLPRGLIISDPSGTVFKGHANRIQWHQYNLGELNWSLAGSKLLSGKVEYELHSGRGSDMHFAVDGSVGYGLFAGVYGENIHASFPVAELAKQFSLPLPLQLNGRLDVKIPHYSYQVPWCKKASGSASWQAGPVGTPLGELNIGNVTSDFTCTNNVLSGEGKQNTKQVSSQFNGNLQSDGRYKLTAWFKPGAQFPDSLKDQLKWLGNPDGQGRYGVNEQGRLRF